MFSTTVKGGSLRSPRHDHDQDVGERITSSTRLHERSLLAS
jgi:hypothetical protein